MIGKQLYYYTGDDHELLDRCQWIYTRYLYKTYFIADQSDYTGCIIIAIEEDDLIVLKLIGNIIPINRAYITFRLLDMIAESGS